MQATSVAAFGVAGAWRGIVRPEHREVRRRHLVAGRQVEPDLEQLQRVGRVRVQQRKHLGVHDAAAGGQPLHVAAAEACVAPSESEWSTRPAHDGHGLEAAVRVRGKPGTVMPWYMRQPSWPAKSWPSCRPVSGASGRSCRCRAGRRRRGGRRTGRGRSSATGKPSGWMRRMALVVIVRQPVAGSRWQVASVARLSSSTTLVVPSSPFAPGIAAAMKVHADRLCLGPDRPGPHCPPLRRSPEQPAGHAPAAACMAAMRPRRRPLPRNGVARRAARRAV
jgi:hypothetical protein